MLCCFIWATFQQSNVQINTPATGKFVPDKAPKQEYNSDGLFIILTTEPNDNRIQSPS